MRALIIVHDPGSEPVLVGDRLEHHGFDLVPFCVTTVANDPAGNANMGNPTDFDLIVAMGSIWSVYDTDNIGSWIKPELDFLRDADTAGVPILGVCFGGQALAAALGGEVVRSEQPQVGWHPLTSDIDALAGPWMQWHYDRFNAPSDSSILACDHVGVQAFTVRRNLGLQFHPEVTLAHLDYWIELGTVEELTHVGIDLGDLRAETAQRDSEMSGRTGRLVDWFLSDIAGL